MLHRPSSELVAIAWLRSLEGVPSEGVATGLPADPSSWSTAGFVQVTAVAGSPAVHTPLRAPVVQVDVWANNLNSQKPPWGKANELMETIIAACYADTQQRTLGMHVAGYQSARLLSVWPLIEPRKVLGDASGFARLSVDLQVTWTAAS